MILQRVGGPLPVSPLTACVTNGDGSCPAPDHTSAAATPKHVDSRCEGHVLRSSPPVPDFGSAPIAPAPREHTHGGTWKVWCCSPHAFQAWVPAGLGTSMAVTILWGDLFRECARYAPAEPLLLAASSSDRVPVVAATDCLVPFLLQPAAALGRRPPASANELNAALFESGLRCGVPAGCVLCCAHPPAPPAPRRYDVYLPSPSYGCFVKSWLLLMCMRQVVLLHRAGACA